MGTLGKNWQELTIEQIADPEAALAAGEEHNELDQVQKDVDRSMWRWGTCEHEYQVRPASPPWVVLLTVLQERIAYREQLTVQMNAVLTLHPELHYYQGYHDVATVLLMCTEDTKMAFGMLRRLSLSHLRYPCHPS